MSSAASDPDRPTTGRSGPDESDPDQATTGRDDPAGSAPDWPAAGWSDPAGPGPGGSWGGPDGSPGRPERPPRQPGRTFAVGAVAVLVLTLLGAPLGLLWAVVSPGVPLVKTADGAILAQPQPEGFIAADGWFSLLGVGFGVLATVGVWLVLRRYRGPVGLAVAVLGGLGAALVAWRTGRLVGLSEYERLLEAAPVGRTFDRPADLRAGGLEWFLGMVPYVRGDLLLAAFAAAVTYTLLAGWSRWPSLRPEAEEDPTASWLPVGAPTLHGPGPVEAGLPGPGPVGPAGPISSDSAGRPTPSAAPEPPAPGAAEPPRG